jgi:hypothetical protein
VALWPSSAECSSAAVAAAAAIPDSIPDGNVAGGGSALVLADARRSALSGARVRGWLSSGERCHCCWSSGGCRRACCWGCELGASGADLSPGAAAENDWGGDRYHIGPDERRGECDRGRRGSGEVAGGVGGALGGATSGGGGWRRSVFPGIERAGA